MPSYATPGITLQVHKYKGTGRVVVFYTALRGKVEAVARGVGRPKSKLASAVEPFVLSKLFLAEGRELDKLTQAEVLESHYPLRRDMNRYGYASLIGELTVKTTEPGHSIQELFTALAEAYRALCDAQVPEIVLWWYLVRLFEISGVSPVLEACCRCGGELGAGACYLPGEGGMVCEACHPPNQGMSLDGSARAVIAGLSRFEADRLNRIKISEENIKQIRRMMDAHIDHQFGLNLKSRDFIRQFQGQDQ
ncbi:MAG: DNA repair protein RecO [Armatimonadota bacterium]